MIGQQNNPKTKYYHQRIIVALKSVSILAIITKLWRQLQSHNRYFSHAADQAQEVWITFSNSNLAYFGSFMIVQPWSESHMSKAHDHLFHTYRMHQPKKSKCNHINNRDKERYMVKWALNIHYSKKLEEQHFDGRFFSLVRILDILGVARWSRCSCNTQIPCVHPNWKILCQKFVPLFFCWIVYIYHIQFCYKCEAYPCWSTFFNNLWIINSARITLCWAIWF